MVHIAVFGIFLRTSRLTETFLVTTLLRGSQYNGTLVAEDGCGIIVTSFLGTLQTTVSNGSFQSLQVVIRSLFARSLARSGWVYSRFTRHATTDKVSTLRQFIVRGIRESSYSYLASRSAIEERLWLMASIRAVIPSLLFIPPSCSAKSSTISM